ncbi:MAG: type I secretion C-terminal target domain-containing protein [Candidatus Magnetomorum sp.]|nr:type I secretion C-terminal target domain-containing protein [Candidatus Magnetomorum sp.]
MKQNIPIIKCQLWLSVLTFILLQTTTGFATLREPETLIYGQVYNQYQNNKILVTDAAIQLTIRKKGSDALLNYEGAVECVKCEQYDPTGLNCMSCEKYAYSIKIPQETTPVIEPDDSTLPVSSINQQYDLLEASVNGEPANMRIKSQFGNIFSTDKQGKFILAGQARRSHYYEIDLEIVLPVVDTDNDSLPDFWEKQYNLNMNDPSDAQTDIDNDGWSNLDEFLNATSPISSNVVPSLLESTILVFEGAQTLFQLNIADSDTPKESFSIKFVNIPDSIQLIFYGDNTPFTHGHVIQQNEKIQRNHLENGNVILKALDTGKLTDRLYILLIDGDHETAVETITIQTFKPTATDATDAILWSDAFYHAKETGDSPSMRLQDRSGNDNRGNYYALLQTDESYVESNINVETNATPGGNSAIRVNGYFELPYATPVFPPGNVTMMAVFKVLPNENDQIIATGSYFEMAVAGQKNLLHPGELRIADESTAVYSNKRVDNDWVLATVTRCDNQTTIDINSVWTGGPFAYEETTELPNDPLMGGKNIWKWDFNNLEWLGNVRGVMNGLFAEMLVFDRPLNYMEKWRIYAHLRGKWFADVISDNSQSARDVKLMAISGKRSELVREKRAEADQAWMAYSDAVFAGENVLQALANLEKLLPDNWQWTTTTPPGVDEALQAIDSIKYNYQKDFVNKYGADHSYILIGGMGNDTIIGGYENDILVGGAGSNILKGCAGQDIFVVTDSDEIIDFNESDHDIVDISHLLDHTKESLGQYIHFELVNDTVTGEVHTLLKIDSQGSGKNFNDAKILLRNVTLRDRVDISRLWASGSIHAGGARPELDVSLKITDNQATETPENSASIEISFSDSRLPENLTIPLIINGSATIGDDFQLKIPVWNKQTNAYESIISDHNVIPISLKPGDQRLNIQIIPIPDHVAEPDESILISLLEKNDYYHLKREALPSIELSDGTDEICIKTTAPIAFEGKTTGASIQISRNGSYDISKEVSLLIKGTADNGRDCYYIPSEMTFSPGETQSTISVVAYKDNEMEDVEFVEVIIASGDYKIKGPASARVEIHDLVPDSIVKGDIDNNGQIELKDAIIALYICSGKNISSVSVIADRSITNGNIGLEEVLYIMDQISN